MGEKPNIVIAPNQWARFGNKFDRWASPSNFYKDWLWQNSNGQILKENEIKLSILKSKKIYSKYNVYTCEKAIKKYSLKNSLPNKFKNKIKKYLSKFFHFI